MALFAHGALEVPYFTGPDGLVDHALVARAFPVTRWSVFQVGMPEWACYAVFGVAIAASACVVAGVAVRASAALMWVAGVSSYRFGYPVSYVDDYLMNALFLWLLLLPLGRTLRLVPLLRRGRSALVDWAGVRVPGVTARLLVANLGLMYGVAGLLKWTSPYWRDGFALFAVLRMPIARSPELFAENNALLVLGTYAALALEPLVPLALALPRGSRLKPAILPFLIAFHLGIAVALRIPFANLALCAAPLVYFREEIGARVRAWAGAAPGPEPPLRLGATGAIAVAAVAALAFLSAARVRPLGIPMSAAVGANRAIAYAGIDQGYALFNWVDVRGIHVDLRARRTRADGESGPLATSSLWPEGLRSTLLLSYLAGQNWAPMPERERRAFAAAIRDRIARRYCALHPPTDRVEVDARIEWTRPLGAPRRELDLRLLEFDCGGKSAVGAGVLAAEAVAPAEPTAPAEPRALEGKGGETDVAASGPEPEGAEPEPVSGSDPQTLRALGEALDALRAALPGDLREGEAHEVETILQEARAELAALVSIAGGLPRQVVTAWRDALINRTRARLIGVIGRQRLDALAGGAGWIHVEQTVERASVQRLAEAARVLQRDAISALDLPPEQTREVLGVAVDLLLKLSDLDARAGELSPDAIRAQRLRLLRSADQRVLRAVGPERYRQYVAYREEWRQHWLQAPPGQAPTFDPDP